MIQLSSEDALFVKKALEKQVEFETKFLIDTNQGRILLDRVDFEQRLVERGRLIRVLENFRGGLEV